MEIGVVGDEDFVLGFKLVGIRKTFVPSNSEYLEQMVSEALADPEVGILVMKDSDFSSLETAKQNLLAESIQPTVITIGKLFPMFELTLDGLDQAVKKLVVRK